MFFITFVRLLPRRIVAAIGWCAAIFHESRALQGKLERDHCRRLDR